MEGQVKILDELKSWAKGYFISLVARRLLIQRRQGGGQKSYALVKAENVYFTCYYYFLKNNIYIYICILKCDFIVFGVVPSYVMPSNALCGSDLPLQGKIRGSLQ